MFSIRRIALTATVLLAWSGCALAADPVYEEPVVASVYDWSGVYLGVQGGYGWADADVTIFTAPPTVGSVDLDGPFVGALAGYNFQSGNFVFGIEGDVNKSWIELDDDDGDAEIDWFGSVRGRVGYAWDRTLLFGTAGIAFASGEVSSIVVGEDDDLSFTGWTAGLGVEHAFTDNWLGRAEYRYYDFGTEDITRGEVDLTMHTVSVGIAYKF
jgi:outer membrane immunogenic protein